MNDKLILLAKTLVVKVTGRAQSEDEDKSIARLQKLSEQQNARAQELLRKVEEQAQYELEAMNAMKNDPLSQSRPPQNQKNEASQMAASHWSRNPDRYYRQNIRTSDQLGGVAAGFEIDPISRLPQEKRK